MSYENRPAYQFNGFGTLEAYISDAKARARNTRDSGNKLITVAETIEREVLILEGALTLAKIERSTMAKNDASTDIKE